jgi:formate hydrogenlyase subunit 4
MTGVLTQLLQMMLVLGAAPLLTGVVRLAKARLVGRRGPSPIQPYRDLLRLLRKEAVVAENASWLFRVTPYMVSPPSGSPPRWCRPSPPAWRWSRRRT